MPLNELMQNNDGLINGLLCAKEKAMIDQNFHKLQLLFTMSKYES